MRHKVRSVRSFGKFLKHRRVEMKLESGSIEDAAKAWDDMMHFVKVMNRREAMKAADRFARVFLRNAH